ncbi:MAG: thioredoxin family protein [Halalkalicoccus sp.]|nr:thioredoxin family protein [Halalkalicoccus sp.]
MTLETMRPNPTWDAKAHERELEPFRRHAEDLTVRVWGGDWCGDCRAVLPDLGAALDAAGIPEEQVHEYPVEKREDGSKEGEKVEEYGIELIPTVIIEREGEEVARFVESEPIPAVAHLAEQLRELEASA